MKEYGTIPTRLVTKLTCDVCKRVADKDDDIWEFQEFSEISFTAGYGSVLGDMNNVAIDLCQHCLKEKLGPWLRITNYWNGEPETLDMLAVDVANTE